MPLSFFLLRSPDVSLETIVFGPPPPEKVLRTASTNPVFGRFPSREWRRLGRRFKWTGFISTACQRACGADQSEACVFYSRAYIYCFIYIFTLAGQLTAIKIYDLRRRGSWEIPRA